MKSQVLHTVWCNISGEAAGEIWYDWSLSGVKGLMTSPFSFVCYVYFITAAKNVPVPMWLDTNSGAGFVELKRSCVMTRQITRVPAFASGHKAPHSLISTPTKLEVVAECTNGKIRIYKMLPWTKRPTTWTNVWSIPTKPAQEHPFYENPDCRVFVKNWIPRATRKWRNYIRPMKMLMPHLSCAFAHIYWQLVSFRASRIIYLNHVRVSVCTARISNVGNSAVSSCLLNFKSKYTT